jgi:hypothetical protein
MHLRLAGGNAYKGRSGACVLSDRVNEATPGALPAEDGRRAMQGDRERFPGAGFDSYLSK